MGAYVDRSVDHVNAGEVHERAQDTAKYARMALDHAQDSCGRLDICVSTYASCTRACTHYRS